MQLVRVELPSIALCDINKRRVCVLQLETDKSCILHFGDKSVPLFNVGKFIRHGLQYRWHQAATNSRFLEYGTVLQAAKRKSKVQSIAELRVTHRAIIQFPLQLRCGSSRVTIIELSAAEMSVKLSNQEQVDMFIKCLFHRTSCYSLQS